MRKQTFTASLDIENWKIWEKNYVSFRGLEW